MKRRIVGAGLLPLFLVSAGPEAAPQAPGLYQQVAQRLAADPQLAARLGQAAPEMSQLAWLVGSWDVSAVVEGKAEQPSDRGVSVVTPVLGGVWLEIRDSYPSGTQDIGYLGWDMATKSWVSLSLDSLGNANRTKAAGWANGSLTLEGDVVIVGLPAHLRQSLHRAGANDYDVVNSERIEGAWRVVDAYHYRRRQN